jgi:hypothetical protein
MRREKGAGKIPAVGKLGADAALLSRLSSLPFLRRWPTFVFIYQDKVLAEIRLPAAGIFHGIISQLPSTLIIVAARETCRVKIKLLPAAAQRNFASLPNFARTHTR